MSCNQAVFGAQGPEGQEMERSENEASDVSRLLSLIVDHQRELIYRYLVLVRDGTGDGERAVVREQVASLAADVERLRQKL